MTRPNEEHVPLQRQAFESGMPAGGPPAGGPPAGASPMGGPPAGFPPQEGAMGQPAGGPIGGGSPGNDPVTGVLNINGFGQAYAMMSSNPPENAALWYVDIRSFRSINPKYGYLMGNMVLNTLASSICEGISRDLPITRLGGDRFVFVSAGLDSDAADAAFHDLVERVNAVTTEKGIEIHMSLVGGIYYLRDVDFEGRDFRRALDYASIAHRNAQSDPHSSLVLFTDEDLERDTRRIIIEQSIDQALAEGQVQVWYQAQVDYTYGEIVGAEALARWNHPELGWISPGEFIPVLEGCGKVHELDLFVWEEACRNAGRWRAAADGKPVPISVNVSRAEMFEPDLLDHFKELKRKYSLPNGSLHLEVTESAFVEEADRLYRVINDMRSHNMVVEMDDFGSGLSSLNMLKDVPVDVVKLDMGFVRSGAKGDRGGVVLGSIIRMLQGLDTPIIAEGVETLEQAEMLKNMGCHLMQGFHFSQPMPLDEFERYVASNSTMESAIRRQRTDSHLEELLSFDKSSSYLFNEGIGGMIYFFIHDNTTESILVNDKFYEDCGLRRSDFGNKKINPVAEVDEESRKVLWRAAAEAREYGSAMCIARVRLTGRWIQGCMRYLGESTRGRIFSLNICRSGPVVEQEVETSRILQDIGWERGVFDKLLPHGFMKCRPDDQLIIDFVTPELLKSLDITYEEFGRRFHSSLIGMLSPADRSAFLAAVRAAEAADALIDCEVRLHQGDGGLVSAGVLGRVLPDGDEGYVLYLLVMLKASVDRKGSGDDSMLFERVIPFDYYMEDDRLVVPKTMPDGTVSDLVIEDWVKRLDDLSDMIDAVSAAKVHAMLRDLKHHPLSGFTDLKANLRGHGELRWYHVNYSCEADDQGNTTVVHCFAHDANDEMGSVKWWRNQAETCQLTGLLNRNAAEERINLLMRRHGSGMMLMIDMDGFKRVNDELGHMVGDDLLHQVASTLSSCFRETDVLGRYGGDEFVACIPLSASVDSRELAQSRADEVIQAIERIEIPDGTHAACSVGVAICENRSASFYDLLEVADQALYASKTSGKGKATIQIMASDAIDPESETEDPDPTVSPQ